MDEFLAELLADLLPAADRDFLAILTPEKRAELAEKITPVVLNPAKMMKWYAERGYKTPASIALKVLEELEQPKKPRGRPAGTTPAQMADDIAFYLAVKWLQAHDGLKMTAACKQVGDKVGRCQQAVFDACKREERRLLKSPE